MNKNAKYQAAHRKKLRTDPVRWEAYLQKRRERDRKRRPRKIPYPEDFDWSLVLNRKVRSDVVQRLQFGPIWDTILFMNPFLWSFRLDCARLNRRHLLKMKARWINQNNPEHVAKTNAYNHRPEVAKRRRKSHQKIRGMTELLRCTPAYRKKIADYEREATNRNPQRRISKRLRTRVYMAIKLGCGVKSARTTELIGCTVLELMRHLESQFQPGMAWENYSLRGWHVDHKSPCASFDMTDPEQQRKCFHYTNLVPMWAVENWSKNSRMPNGLFIKKKRGSVPISA